MTPRQRRFVEEYLVDLNATAAAKRAGYSARSVQHNGYRLLKNPAIAAAVAKAQARRAARTQVSADRVVTELAKVAFGDPRRLLSWGPDGVVLRDSSELTEAEAALVSEVSETRTAAGGTRRVKLHCKLTALNALGKHLGLFGNGRQSALAHALAQNGGAGTDDNGEAEPADDPRERLARRIAGIAARLATKDPDRGTD
jgi:phage terminase small subunit